MAPLAKIRGRRRRDRVARSADFTVALTPKRKERDEKARALYREEAARQGIDGIFLRDLLREEVTDLAGL